MLRRDVPLTVVFALCAAVYVATLGGRLTGPSPNNHYAHLAESFLNGQLHLVAERPPGRNDWARYDGRWYVTFPPFPALLLTPLVAIWGTGAWDPLFWALFAGLGPVCVLRLLRRLRAEGHSERSPAEELGLTLLFAFGTSYYYASVQGSVWFAAHVVSVPLSALFLDFATGARRPVLSGLCLAACFLTRPSTLLLALYFGLQAIDAARSAPTDRADPNAGPLSRALRFVGSADAARWFPRCLRFALPIVATLGLALWLNAARFDDPFVSGHEHLQIRWRARIERWGLFDLHYLGRNLGIWLASLPWLLSEAPYLRISRHGLALWVTTPNLLWLLWPTRWTSTMVSLALAASATALLDLCYQNSGWIQFGYRFGLDYMPALFALLALGGRRFGPGFKLLAAVAIAINLFGAVTFDRVHRFYDDDPTQRRIFQPD